jgi:cell division control protein 24
MEVVAPTYLPRNPSYGSRLKTYATSGMSSTPAHQSTSTAHYSTYSQPSSLRSSDSTAATNATSASTLFNQPPLPTGTPIPTSGTPVQTDTNVLNKRADKEASLFQICLHLRHRLQAVPGFDIHLEEEEEDGSDSEDIDPVTLLWRTFRRGYPLMTIYNALGPSVPLVIDENKVKPEKRAQAATAKFLNACTKQLRFPTEECFIISDLFLDDTTGFVKVRFTYFPNATTSRRSKVPYHVTWADSRIR